MQQCHFRSRPSPCRDWKADPPDQEVEHDARATPKTQTGRRPTGNWPNPRHSEEIRPRRSAQAQILRGASLFDALPIDPRGPHYLTLGCLPDETKTAVASLIVAPALHPAVVEAADDDFFEGPRVRSRRRRRWSQAQPSSRNRRTRIPPALSLHAQTLRGAPLPGALAIDPRGPLLRCGHAPSAHGSKRRRQPAAVDPVTITPAPRRNTRRWVFAGTIIQRTFLCALGGLRARAPSERRAATTRPRELGLPGGKEGRSETGFRWTWQGWPAYRPSG
jgi:hypothetical protein